MQIHFTGHHVDVTPALKSFTEEKLHKLVHHFDNIIDMHVTFNVEKLLHKVEASVKFSGGHAHAASESTDMYAAVDELIDKLHGQLKKHKDKNHAHRD